MTEPQPRSIANIINWRRYLVVLAVSVPLAGVLVALDALVGIGSPWTFYGVLAVYCAAGLWWCTPKEDAGVE